MRVFIIGILILLTVYSTLNKWLLMFSISNEFDILGFNALFHEYLFYFFCYKINMKYIEYGW